MSPLWAIAPGAVSVGGIVALVGLRRISETAAEVGAELERLREVRTALVDVRAATDDTVAAARRVRERPAPWA
jgi:hypothetical protein